MGQVGLIVTKGEALPQIRRSLLVISSPQKTGGWDLAVGRSPPGRADHEGRAEMEGDKTVKTRRWLTRLVAGLRALAAPAGRTTVKGGDEMRHSGTPLLVALQALQVAAPVKLQSP